jgi:hypothetical protein
MLFFIIGVHKHIIFTENADLMIRCYMKRETVTSYKKQLTMARE